MGSINFAAPFQLLRSIGAAATQLRSSTTCWARWRRCNRCRSRLNSWRIRIISGCAKKSDGQVVSVLPGDFDPKKHDKL
jgi:hypothetical protein